MCSTKPLLIHLVRGGVGIVLIIAALSCAGCLSRLPDLLDRRII